MQKTFFDIKRAIDDSQKILLFAHPELDGDALGSMLALKIALSDMGKQADAFSLSQMPEAFKFLPKTEQISQKINDDYDLIFGLDYADVRRLEPMIRDLCASHRTITIDHHSLVNQVGEIKITDPNFSSTCEIIHQFLTFNTLKIDKEIATCLLAGIIYDTWSFRHSNTTSQTLKIVADLLSRGAVLNKIVRLMNQHGINAKSRIWSRVLANISLEKELGFAFCFLNFQELARLKVAPDDLDGLCNIISMAPEVRFSLLLKEFQPDGLDGSLRSKTESGIDVSQIARLFGGGGHALAAGFKINGRPEQVLDKIKEFVMLKDMAR